MFSIPRKDKNCIANSLKMMHQRILQFRSNCNYQPSSKTPGSASYKLFIVPKITLTRKLFDLRTNSITVAVSPPRSKPTLICFFVITNRKNLF
jgi:hypothetical protein